MAEEILKSKIRRKRGLVGYVNNLFKKMYKIYATHDIGKLNLLSSYKYITEDKLVKIMNLWEEVNYNIEDEVEFQNELSQSLQFEVLFLKRKKFLLSIKQVQAILETVANIQAMLSYLKLR